MKCDCKTKWQSNSLCFQSGPYAIVQNNVTDSIVIMLAYDAITSKWHKLCWVSQIIQFRTSNIFANFCVSNVLFGILSIGLRDYWTYRWRELCISVLFYWNTSVLCSTLPAVEIMLRHSLYHVLGVGPNIILYSLILIQKQLKSQQ